MVEYESNIYINQSRDTRNNPQEHQETVQTTALPW